MPAIDLDNPATYPQLDPGDMYRRVNELPEQIEDAWRIAASVEVPRSYRDVSSIVIAGMGGSAISGSLLEAYGASSLPIPLTVWRNYGLPASVGPQTLVIAMSYSGSTEETLSALQAGHEAGAKLLAVATGGTVADDMSRWNAPVVQFQYKAQPRATLGYLFTPLLCLVGKIGFLPDQEEAVRQAADAARKGREKWAAERPESENAAKQLARSCHGRLAVIYGPDYLGAVARRWKTQFNENAKQWAFYEEFPELNHNAIVGYEYPPAITRETAVLVLDAPNIPPRIRIRMRVTGEIMEGAGIQAQTVQPQGSGRLAHMVSHIALGDYVTYYLALLNGADPSIIGPIDKLKAELAKA